MLGENLVSNFPVIDRWSVSNGVATSIKSIDLNAASYQNISALARKVTGYVNTLANWQGMMSGATRILADDIVGRELLLAISSGATEAQMEKLQQLQQWATTVGVAVHITVVPWSSKEDRWSGKASPSTHGILSVLSRSRHHSGR
jgi:filamentous hemagglutinin